LPFQPAVAGEGGCSQAEASHFAQDKKLLHFPCVAYSSHPADVILRKLSA